MAIYLDYNATTPVEPAVLDAMLPFLKGEFGNPSSNYELGRRARAALENARAEVAALINAKPDEILFTSGGTESSNIAIRGAALADPARRGVVTTTIEHPATEACCNYLEANGHTIKRIAPGADGRVVASKISAAIDGQTAIVSIIHAQNEIGTLQPIGEIAPAARKHGALLHADAAQSIGKVPVDVEAMGVDLLSIAGHKLYAPKGVGVLYIRNGTRLAPMLLGAGQEHGRRPGTENVAYIVGLGEACRLARLGLDKSQNLSALSKSLLGKLKDQVPGLTLVGHPTERLPNTLNVLFPGVSGRQLLAACPQVMASNGSACHADSESPSAILLAVGIAPDAALGTVRISLGRHTTQAEVDAAATHLAAAWRSLRAPQRAAS